MKLLLQGFLLSTLSMSVATANDDDFRTPVRPTHRASGNATLVNSISAAIQVVQGTPDSDSVQDLPQFTSLLSRDEITGEPATEESASENAASFCLSLCASQITEGSKLENNHGQIGLDKSADIIAFLEGEDHRSNPADFRTPVRPTLLASGNATPVNSTSAAIQVVQGTPDSDSGEYIDQGVDPALAHFISLFPPDETIEESVSESASPVSGSQQALPSFFGLDFIAGPLDFLDSDSDSDSGPYLGLVSVSDSDN